MQLLILLKRFSLWYLLYFMIQDAHEESRILASWSQEESPL